MSDNILQVHADGLFNALNADVAEAALIFLDFTAAFPSVAHE